MSFMKKDTIYRVKNPQLEEIKINELGYNYFYIVLDH